MFSWNLQLNAVESICLKKGTQKSQKMTILKKYFESMKHTSTIDIQKIQNIFEKDYFGAPLACPQLKLDVTGICAELLY